MAHMKPQYRTEDFYRVTRTNGDVELWPADEFVMEEDLSKSGKHTLRGDDVELITGKVFWRLSAPGYLDRTDWYGPCDTLDEAKRDCIAEFDVHPDTGDELPEGDDAPGPICGARGCTCHSAGECEEHLLDGGADE